MAKLKLKTEKVPFAERLWGAPTPSLPLIAGQKVKLTREAAEKACGGIESLYDVEAVVSKIEVSADEIQTVFLKWDSDDEVTSHPLSDILVPEPLPEKKKRAYKARVKKCTGVTAEAIQQAIDAVPL